MPTSPRSVQLKCLTQAWVCVGAGTSKVALVRFPCCRTAGGESSSVFLLREFLDGKPWGTMVFQELWVSKLILCLHGCNKHSLNSYSKALRKLCGLCSLSKRGFLLVSSCAGDLLPELKVDLAVFPWNVFPGGCTSRSPWLALGHDSSRLQWLAQAHPLILVWPTFLSSTNRAQAAPPAVLKIFPIFHYHLAASNLVFYTILSACVSVESWII